MVASLKRVVSGGQTGADQAALEVAKSLGYETGGWAPAGFPTEAGPRPDLAGLYGLRETPSDLYVQRTKWNVRDADHTLVLVCGADEAGWGRGTRLTLRCCRELYKPHTVVDLDAVGEEGAAYARRCLEGVGVLNVAGPRESSRPGVGTRAREFLLRVLRREGD